MPDDALIIAIEQDAKTQCEKLLHDAEVAAAEMLEAAKEATMKESAERAAALEASLERKAAASVNAARTRAAGRLLSVREELAEEVLKRAEKGFRDMERGRYCALLNGFYDELKKDWFEANEPDSHAVLLNPDDMGLIEDAGAEFRADPGVSLGVVFVSIDGRLRYENTVPSRIWKARESLLTLIDGILAGRG